MRISLEECVQQLNTGHVVAVPTETVYGLAASLHSPKAISDIFHIKGRPQDNPLIVHIGSIENSLSLIKNIPPQFDLLTDSFWPGPLTLIADAHDVPGIVRAGLDTVGIRMPNHPVTLELLKQTGPLVMPSANLSGRPSSTCPEHVEEDFGTTFPILDGGASLQGIESTIVRYFQDKWVILRLGAISAEVLEEVLGYPPEYLHANSKPLCPGQFYRHYAPKTKMYEFPKVCGVIVGFSDRTYTKDALFYQLGHSSDPEGCLANLYHVLRKLDEDQVNEATIDNQIPSTGLWVTLRDRFQKILTKKSCD